MIYIAIAIAAIAVGMTAYFKLHHHKPQYALFVHGLTLSVSGALLAIAFTSWETTMAARCKFHKNASAAIYEIENIPVNVEQNNYSRRVPELLHWVSGDKDAADFVSSEDRHYLKLAFNKFASDNPSLANLKIEVLAKLREIETSTEPPFYYFCGATSTGDGLSG